MSDNKNEGRSPRRHYIFRHWSSERYASTKHTSKKGKWFLLEDYRV